MFRRNHPSYLPLLLSGLPVFAMEWIRIAGIPAVPFQSSMICREGKNATGQILVFDARNPTGRLDARMARENGAEIINVGDLLPRAATAQAGEDKGNGQKPSPLQPFRAALFSELKLRVESAGGFWLRLADYPFPYQSAFCRCRNPEQIQRKFAEEFAVTTGDGSSTNSDSLFETARAWVGERHTSGQPVFCGDSRLQSLADDTDVPNVAEADEYPLMWQTTGDEFLQWVRLRSRIAVTATKTGSTYHIQSNGITGRFQPTVELWLGNHVASLPLTNSAMTIREEGILFLQEHRRHAAGLAAGWSDSSYRPQILKSPVQHSV